MFNGLPTYKYNYQARIASVTLQGLLLAVLAYVGAAPAVQLVKTVGHLVYTPIVIAVTPKWQPSVRQQYIAPPVIARIIVPKPSPVIKAPVIEAPKVEIQAKVLPNIPVSPVIPRKPVQVGGFETKEMATLPKDTQVSKVQTGGVGDPNGVKGVGNGKGLPIASLGQFDMPGGPGYGNGTGGKNGKVGVVRSSGFGNAEYGAQGRTGSSGGVSATLKVAAETPLIILDHPRPNYTDEGRKLGIQGEVLLRVRFTANGTIEVLNVIQGLGHGLDEQAVIASKKITFKPVERNGAPVDFEGTVHVRFELA
jgi:TonB family protein